MDSFIHRLLRAALFSCTIDFLYGESGSVLKGFLFRDFVFYGQEFLQEEMSRGVHDFDPHNSVIFSHIENDLFGDSFVNHILRFVVKPDVEEVRKRP